MIAEKIFAVQELQFKALTGKLGSTPLFIMRASLTHIGGKVRANRKRLGKSRTNLNQGARR